jgi:hypothetical protein
LDSATSAPAARAISSSLSRGAAENSDVRLEPAAQHAALDLGHVEVGEDEVRAKLLERAVEGDQVDRGADLEAVLRQARGDDLEREGAVVEDQDSSPGVHASILMRSRS